MSRKSRTSAKADLLPSSRGDCSLPSLLSSSTWSDYFSTLGTSIDAKLGGFTNHLLVNCSTFSEMYLNTIMSETLRCILKKTRRILHHSRRNLQFTSHLLVNCSTFSKIYLNTVMSETLRCILKKTLCVLQHSRRNLQFRGFINYLLVNCSTFSEMYLNTTDFIVSSSTRVYPRTATRFLL